MKDKTVDYQLVRIFEIVPTPLDPEPRAPTLVTGDEFLLLPKYVVLNRLGGLGEPGLNLRDEHAPNAIRITASSDL
jgi:hypothetical protein